MIRRQQETDSIDLIEPSKTMAYSEARLEIERLIVIERGIVSFFLPRPQTAALDLEPKKSEVKMCSD